MLDAPSAIADRLITAVDMGTLQRRRRRVAAYDRPSPVRRSGAINHEHITEVYYIISGTGHAAHRRDGHQPARGGRRQRDRQGRRRSEQSGHVRQAGAAPQGRPGDVVIIPPGRVSRLRRGDDRYRLSGRAAGPEQGAAGRVSASGRAGVSSEATVMRHACAVVVLIAAAAASRCVVRRDAGVASVRGVSAAQAARADAAFEVDASWPQLPNNWVLGQTPGIAVDRHDHVWILHRPRTVPEEQRAQRRARRCSSSTRRASSSTRGAGRGRDSTGRTASTASSSTTRTTSGLAAAARRRTR